MNPLLEQLEALVAAAEQERQAGETSGSIRQKYLGRQGSFTALLKEIAQQPAEERQALGEAAQKLRQRIDASIAEKTEAADIPDIDLSLPGVVNNNGGLHPVTVFTEELISIFRGLSFEVVEGNELVTDWENFGSLNFKEGHPARDAHDTFFIGDQMLRTHTSAQQVKEMKRRVEQGELPIRFVIPGKTYRVDSDATHSPMFHQLEGVIVDNQTTFSDLKGTLDYLAKCLFGPTIETRFRTHHFPFTEPSAEMDIRVIKEGQGAHDGWLEILGCGMIHPNVLREAGINSKAYQGWAFGLGIERPIMIRRQLPDLRMLFNGAKNTLDQLKDLI